MTFEEWFKVAYPLWRDDRDQTLKHQLRAAWTAGAESKYVGESQWKDLAHEAFLQLEYVNQRTPEDRRHSSTAAVLLRLSEKLGVPLEISRISGGEG